jgi:2-methylisocitrate lyase-like PEP mutase family enzyme
MTAAQSSCSLIYQEKRMTDQTRKVEQFWALHIPGKPFVLYNIWDVGGTKAIASSAAKAIATGSWSVANANGFADGERIPLALAIAICVGSSARQICL